LPSIQLTASGGTASDRLGGLFGGGHGHVELPANHHSADIQRRTEPRQSRPDTYREERGYRPYELTIQTAFREVSDALSARGTYLEQQRAQEALVAADADAYRLAEMRFRSGVDSYLATLDAQRSLYAAQQGLAAVREAALANQVTLYKALGGGWQPQTTEPR